MKTLLIILVLSIVDCSSIAQEPLNLIKYEDVKIFSTKTGRSLLRKEGFNSRDSLIAKFGQPDSITTTDEVAIGGVADNFYYGKNHFSFLVGEDNLQSYWIMSNDFQIVIKDSIIVEVGNNIEEYSNKLKSRTQYGNNYLDLSFDGNLWRSIVIIYDPKTKIIKRIYDSPRS